MLKDDFIFLFQNIIQEKKTFKKIEYKIKRKLLLLNLFIH